jgi:hypothetical protein
MASRQESSRHECCLAIERCLEKNNLPIEKRLGIDNAIRELWQTTTGEPMKDI